MGYEFNALDNQEFDDYPDPLTTKLIKPLPTIELYQVDAISATTLIFFWRILPTTHCRGPAPDARARPSLECGPRWPPSTLISYITRYHYIPRFASLYQGHRATRPSVKQLAPSHLGHAPHDSMAA